ncbi:MAG: LCP family protein [Candidatus Dojkabacteria bacterium]|nr:LCP family protein [Candidatus Dojkabacteria bacterium]
MKSPFFFLKRKVKRRRLKKKSGVRASLIRFGGNAAVARSVRNKNLSNLVLTFIVIIVLLGIVGWTVFSAYKLFSFNLKRAYRDERVIDRQWKGDSRLTILFVGLDGREGEYAYADAILLLMIDPDAKTLGVFDINPDAVVYVPEYDTEEKLRNVYNRGVIGKESIPVLLLKKRIERLFSIQIDRYVVVKEEGLVEIVDSLGGVYVNNENDLVDSDAGEKGINLSVGSFRLNGEDYLGYVSADILGTEAKLMRQNEGIINLLQRTVNYAAFLKIPQIIDTISDNVKTDLSRAEILRLGIAISRSNDVKSGYTKNNAFDVEENNSKLIPVWEEIDRELQEIFIDPQIGKEQARVEVFNSTGTIGLGSLHARWLRNMGVDVIRVGDTSEIFERTTIYAKDPGEFIHTIKGIKKSFDEEPEVIEGEPDDVVTTGDVILIIGNNDKDSFY